MEWKSHELPQAGAYLITAVGQQQEERLYRTVSRQVVKEVQADIITPMNILNDEQHALLPGLGRTARGQLGGGVSPVRGWARMGYARPLNLVQ